MSTTTRPRIRQLRRFVLLAALAPLLAASPVNAKGRVAKSNTGIRAPSQDRSPAGIFEELSELFDLEPYVTCCFGFCEDERGVTIGRRDVREEDIRIEIPALIRKLRAAGKLVDRRYDTTLPTAIGSSPLDAGALVIQLDALLAEAAAIYRAAVDAGLHHGGSNWWQASDAAGRMIQDLEDRNPVYRIINTLMGASDDAVRDFMHRKEEELGRDLDGDDFVGDPGDRDTDGDGRCDAATEDCNGNGFIGDPGERDINGDGVCNGDEDCDGDGKAGIWVPPGADGPGSGPVVFVPRGMVIPDLFELAHLFGGHTVLDALAHLQSDLLDFGQRIRSIGERSDRRSRHRSRSRRRR